MKRIFEITREIADLGFVEKDIHEIAKDEDLYVRYETWRKSKNIYVLNNYISYKFLDFLQASYLT